MQDMIMISVKWWNHVNLKAFQETDYFWAEKTVGNFTNYSWSQWRWLWLKLHVWLHACNLFRSILGKPAPAWLNGFSWESSQIHTEWDFIKVEFKLGECYPAHWLIFNSFLLTKSLNCQDSGGHRHSGRLILHFACDWLCNMPSKPGRSMAFGRKDRENGVMSNGSHGNLMPSRRSELRFPEDIEDYGGRWLNTSELAKTMQEVDDDDDDDECQWSWCWWWSWWGYGIL